MRELGVMKEFVAKTAGEKHQLCPCTWLECGELAWGS